MTCCNVIIPNNKISLCILPMAGCSGGPEHFDILVISWQFEHFWANNWQGINNSHRTIKLWFNEEKLFHLIFTIYQNYPLALTLAFNIGAIVTGANVHLINRQNNNPVWPGQDGSLSRRPIPWSECVNLECT